MRFIRGFSLIELMVVIAIVAVLAAVAIPAYREYIYKVHATSIINLMSDIMKQSVEYYTKHGSYPSYIQLGYPNDGGYIANPEQLSPYAERIWVGSYELSCGVNFGQVELQVLPDTLSSEDPPQIYFDYVELPNGDIISTCTLDGDEDDPEPPWLKYFTNCINPKVGTPFELAAIEEMDALACP
jgi:prepilin-type N-terminal cleavage/methylation domain-containing protein